MTLASETPKEQQTPYDSPWSLKLKVKKVVWNIVWAVLCSWTPKPLNAWRVLWLRAFGAQISGMPFVHQKAIIEFPWNLTLENRACIGNKTNIYSLGMVTIKEGATVAQEAYLCTGTHDLSDPSFRLIVKPIIIGKNAFIGVRALILPGMRIGSNSIVGAGSLVSKDVKGNLIVAGNPAREIRMRN